jgi:ABC-type sugar transport system substrate-binding protein
MLYRRTFLTVVTLLAVLAGLLGSVDPAVAQADKVTICHIPPGNPDAAHLITISTDALPAHLAHGC